MNLHLSSYIIKFWLNILFGYSPAIPGGAFKNKNATDSQIIDNQSVNTCGKKI